MREKLRGSLLCQAAKSRLINFCEIIDKNWETVWFHEYIADTLQKVVEKVKRKEKARVILAIPPRSGKSQIASIYFPAWILGNHPDMQFILATYGAELAERIGQKARDVITSEGYQTIFPDIQLRQDTKAKAKWMTNKGGGFIATGVGGAITGSGAQIVICDDLIKSREEAESQTVRDTVWEYYRSTLYSRLEGAGAVIVIMQRWHTDDVVGRLLEEDEKRKAAGDPTEDWEVINFPAIAEEDEYVNGKLVRKEGEPLWPSKFPLEVLNNIKAVSGVYNFQSQYMQQPISSETQEFKSFMFRYYNEEDLEGKYLKYVTLIDPAISQKKEGDNTVVLTIAKEVEGPNIYRIEETAGHFTPQETVDLIFYHQGKYKSDIYLETVAYQQALKFAIMEEQRKKMKYFLVNELKTATNKEMRIRGLLPLYNAGVIFHKRSDSDYERELLVFPKGKRDDRIDCMSFMLKAFETGIGGKAKQFIPKWKGTKRK